MQSPPTMTTMAKNGMLQEGWNSRKEVSKTPRLTGLYWAASVQCEAKDSVRCYNNTSFRLRPLRCCHKHSDRKDRSGKLFRELVATPQRNRCTATSAEKTVAGQQAKHKPPRRKQQTKRVNKNSTVSCLVRASQSPSPHFSKSLAVALEARERERERPTATP